MKTWVALILGTSIVTLGFFTYLEFCTNGETIKRVVTWDKRRRRKKRGKMSVRALCTDRFEELCDYFPPDILVEDLRDEDDKDLILKVVDKKHMLKMKIFLRTRLFGDS